MSQDNTTARRCTIWIPLLLVAFLVGYLSSGANNAVGEIRKRPEHGHFKSGAAQNGPVLREISQTLKRIDTRLQRLEARWQEQQRQSRK